MKLTSQHRVAEVLGRVGLFRIVQKARRNSRIIEVDLTTGEQVGESELVPTSQLVNVRNYELSAETPRTIRIPGRVHESLARLAKPFETPADVIARLIQHQAEMRTSTPDFESTFEKIDVIRLTQNISEVLMYETPLNLDGSASPARYGSDTPNIRVQFKRDAESNKWEVTNDPHGTAAYEFRAYWDKCVILARKRLESASD